MGRVWEESNFYRNTMAQSTENQEVYSQQFSVYNSFLVSQIKKSFSF
jgi:hypothetical protein